MERAVARNLLAKHQSGLGIYTSCNCNFPILALFFFLLLLEEQAKGYRDIYAKLKTFVKLKAVGREGSSASCKEDAKEQSE